MKKISLIILSLFFCFAGTLGDTKEWSKEESDRLWKVFQKAEDLNNKAQANCSLAQENYNKAQKAYFAYKQPLTPITQQSAMMPSQQQHLTLCKSGYEWNANKNSCQEIDSPLTPIIDSPLTPIQTAGFDLHKCRSGYEWNANYKRCQSKCKSGYEWNANKNSCQEKERGGNR